MRFVGALVIAVAFSSMGASVVAAAADNRLRIISWNAAWLADPVKLVDSYWIPCASEGFPGKKLEPSLPYCDVYSRDGIRNAPDYETRKLVPMRRTLKRWALGRTVDVIAVQEVSDQQALEAVLPEGYRVACFTSSPDAQNVGYAVRNATNIEFTCREVTELSLEDVPDEARPLRRGLELRARMSGMKPEREVVLLNVHLKSSCPTGRMDRASDDCALLRLQVPRLETWIEERARAKEAFAIIGDWNRDIEVEVGRPARSDGSNPKSPVADARLIRNLWPEINDHDPPQSAMRLAKVDRSAANGAGGCYRNLDQLAISELLSAQLVTSSLSPGTVAARLIAPERGASDHCLLAVDFKWR